MFIFCITGNERIKDLLHCPSILSMLLGLTKSESDIGPNPDLCFKDDFSFDLPVVNILCLSQGRFSSNISLRIG